MGWPSTIEWVLTMAQMGISRNGDTPRAGWFGGSLILGNLQMALGNFDGLISRYVKMMDDDSMWYHDYKISWWSNDLHITSKGF